MLPLRGIGKTTKNKKLYDIVLTISDFIITTTTTARFHSNSFMETTNNNELLILLELGLHRENYVFSWFGFCVGMYLLVANVKCGSHYRDAASVTKPSECIALSTWWLFANVMLPVICIPWCFFFEKINKFWHCLCLFPVGNVQFTLVHSPFNLPYL